MGALDLARWQFGVTTVYHFFFVPITIGLSALVAALQTAWYRTGNPAYERLTKFWGKLFLINFAMGVVTGIVQEFQFGMNWSDYSRYVGDVFGAPLAMEALLAFFLESTFLGLWIFGWGRLSKGLHLATIWLAAIGTTLSAYFILAANSWMQHPVGYRINPDTKRAELTSIWKVLTNSTTLVAFPHTVTAAFLTGGLFMLGISLWQITRRRDVEVFGKSLRLGVVTVLIAAVGVMLSGHLQGQIMTEQQPMKMAAAEALWTTEKSAGFSLFAVGDVANGRNHIDLKVPGLLSFMAHNNPNSTVRGMNDIQAEYERVYGPGDYKPIVGVTYWSFRLMIGLGAISAGFALAAGWLARRGRLVGNRWLGVAAIGAIALPLLANTAGWIFTEMGRQPWLVFGQLKTAAGVSPGVTAATVLTSLIVFALLYAVLAAIEVRLLVRAVRSGLPAQPARHGTGRASPSSLLGDETDLEDEAAPELALVY